MDTLCILIAAIATITAFLRTHFSGLSAGECRVVRPLQSPGRSGPVAHPRPITDSSCHRLALRRIALAPGPPRAGGEGIAHPCSAASVFGPPRSVAPAAAADFYHSPQLDL